MRPRVEMVAGWRVVIQPTESFHEHEECFKKAHNSFKHAKHVSVQTSSISSVAIIKKV